MDQYEAIGSFGEVNDLGVWAAIAADAVDVLFLLAEN
jgi:hypothetical protein